MRLELRITKPPSTGWSVLRIDPAAAGTFLSFTALQPWEGPGRSARGGAAPVNGGQLTFVDPKETDQRESSIKAQAQQLLAGHREEEALQLYQRHFHGTSATAADSYVFVGKLYLFMGKTEDGLRCLHQALKMQPTVRGAHTYEGILALKLGDLSRAENEFKTELANDPNYQMAIAELGEVRYHQERWAEAAEQLTKSRTMTPELLYMLCDADFRLGKVADANLTAETAAAYSRNSPEVMRGLIELLVRNGQSDLARRLSANQAR
jgi:tetratricopeptide (TPR) repeat protein